MVSKWLRCTRGWCVAQPRKSYGRLFSTHSSVELVRVPCASAGDITLSLHNISKHDTTTPLVILIPPFPTPYLDPTTPVPSCFQDYPAAVINYRWQPADGDERPQIPLHWPAPLHDISFGYTWLMDNLGSGTDNSTDPRPAYVYGSYLGASLASGLALTESHIPIRSRPMTIRGLVAHNGIYNWTMFLPDHPIHKLKTKPGSKRRKRGGLHLPFAALDDGNPIPVEEEGIFTTLKHQAPGLFSSPSNFFDPFASACLFFHSANLHVPDDFITPLSTHHSSLSAEFTAAVDALAGSKAADNQPDDSPREEQGEEETASSLLTRAATLAKQLHPPRKGYLVFPPRHSTLRIPPTLFIHDRPHNYYSSSLSSPSSAGHTHTDSSFSTEQQQQQQRRRRQQRQTSNKHTGPNPAYGTSKNNFRHQATELAGLMLRSLDMHELRPKLRSAAPWEWEGEEAVADGSGEGEGGEESVFALRRRRQQRGDEDDMRARELERRVQSFEVESPREGGSGWGLDEKGEEVVGEWLRERMDEDFGGDGDGDGDGIGGCVG